MLDFERFGNIVFDVNGVLLLVNLLLGAPPKRPMWGQREVAQRPLGGFFPVAAHGSAGTGAAPQSGRSRAF